MSIVVVTVTGNVYVARTKDFTKCRTKKKEKGFKLLFTVSERGKKKRSQMT